MADEVEFQSTITATPPPGMKVATEEINGKKYQRMKLVLGAFGDDDGDLSSAVRLPVELSALIIVNEEILYQLKIMNKYLSILTNEEING